MKYLAALSVFVLLLFSSCQKQTKQSLDVDFEESMGKSGSDWSSIMEHKGNKERVALLKSVYDSKKPSNLSFCSQPKIPKIIHQIWLGPKTLPHYFWEYKKTWEQQHPDWEYRLWQDKDVENLDFELKDLFLRSSNYGEKADILRAELLDRFGGLYVDVDIECKKSFDELHEKYDFFAGLEPPHQGDFTQSAPHIVISNALIGASPHHPIIQDWKVRIRAGWDELEMRYPDSAKRVLLRAFYPFGEAVVSNISDPTRCNIVFPPTYFYPLTFTVVSKGRLKKMSFYKRQIQNVLSCFGKEKAPFVEIRPETMAVHYWGNSWVKSNEERLREMYKHLLQLEEQTRQNIQRLDQRLAELNDKMQMMNRENAA